MHPFVYKVLHLAAVLGLFTALASLASSNDPKLRRGSSILHGVSLLLVLVAGFGLLAKLHYGFPGWIIAKLVIWALFGGLLVATRRRLLPPAPTIALILALGTLSAWLATFKPF